MNSKLMYVESNTIPKTVPSIVSLAYQAALTLQEKISQAKTLSLEASMESVKKDDLTIPLWQRYSLSVPEAAKYFGIGEGRLYQIIAEHPKADFILEVGSHVKIKRVLFERFLDSASCV